VNKTVTVGDDTWFHCSTDLAMPVIWNKYTPHNAKIVVYRLGQIHQKLRRRFRVSPAVRGQYNLAIISVRSDDQGFYECKDRAGIGKSAKAFLSVRPKIAAQQTPGNSVLLKISK